MRHVFSKIYQTKKEKKQQSEIRILVRTSDKTNDFSAVDTTIIWRYDIQL